MPGPYDWFYGASPEQQAAYIAQGMLPPDYPQGGPAVASPSQSGAPPVSPLITFDDQGRGNGPGVTDFGSWLYNQMTPEQQAEFVARGEAEANQPGGIPQAPLLAYQASGGDWPYQPPEVQLHHNVGNRIASTDAQNRAEIARLQALADQTSGNNRKVLENVASQISAQDPRNAAFVQQSRDLATQLGGHRDAANQGALQSLGAYTTELQGLSQQNNQRIAALDGIYDQLATPLQSGVSWDGDLTSQAAIADPAILAQQQQALGFLGGAAGGSLDYTSQAAGAYADPKYVAMRDQGLEDLYGVSQGSKDVVVGEADPAAYAAAQEAMYKMRDLSNPAVTEEENFLYEQARQAQEMEERGLSAARMSNLRRRGMAGGGAEFTQNALDSQRISQNRVLSDLGAAANAQQRATKMLEMYGGLSSRLNSEANAIATGNKNRQLQALGLYQQGAEVAQQSSFDQEYKRGLAADQASRDNQSTRLNAGIAHGNQANAMQQQHFQRGMAADEMARYNRSTSLDVDMFNANFDQRERDALWGRTTDRTALGLKASAQNSNNASNIFNGTQSVINNNYYRDKDVIAGFDTANERENRLQNQQVDRWQNFGNTEINTNNTALGTQGNIIGMNIGQNNTTTAQLNANDTSLGGYFSSEEAAAQAKAASDAAAEDANWEGIGGLPLIGSNYGLKGLVTGRWFNGGKTWNGSV
jgi:hypothetical protein